MILTPRFVFLHLHKSGGTFVNEGLMRFLADAQQAGYHLPWSRVPADHARLPALGLVRNPWSYYVSWYAFQRSRNTPNILYRLMSDDGQLDFEATLSNLLSLGGEHPHRFEELIGALPDHFVNRGLNLPSFALRRIPGSQMGFYSFLYHHMYEGAPQLNIVRMEDMRRSLAWQLRQIGQPVETALETYLTSAPALNQSDHGDWRRYYNARSERLVAERDGALIEQHQYRFAA